MSEESLFELALNVPEAERPALLDRECKGDDALRARVQALLSAHGRPADWLAPHGPTGPHQGGNDAPTADLAGAVIAGRYKLLQQIGEGGTGSVGKAGRREPVRRKGAAKRVRAESRGSRPNLARFPAQPASTGRH